MHLLFELPFGLFLSFQSLFESPLLSKQTPHAHPQIFDNQLQIIEHPREVGFFLLHFVGLIFQLVDGVSPRPNVPFEFFYFVIENKLELLELLSLLLQVVDALIFVPDSGLSLTQL
jgi:hypothetical protein